MLRSNLGNSLASMLVSGSMVLFDWCRRDAAVVPHHFSTVHRQLVLYLFHMWGLRLARIDPAPHHRHLRGTCEAYVLSVEGSTGGGQIGGGVDVGRTHGRYADACGLDVLNGQALTDL